MRCRRCAPLPEEVRRAAGLLERRWTVSILWASYEGALRFNEFKQSLGEIPPRTLAQRLVELEEAGVLERRVVDARPPRVEYRLTDDGLRLKQVVDAVVAWAGRD
jgi:DNA-binding HxlR family transcriptional regulator